MCVCVCVCTVFYTGGAGDEAQLISLLTRSLSPSWSLSRVQSQARWAVVQAFVLLQEHRGALEEIVRVLEDRDREKMWVRQTETVTETERQKGKTRERKTERYKGETNVGDLLMSLSQTLPNPLPAVQRQRQIYDQARDRERQRLLRLVQSRTWRVGGLSMDIDEEVEREIERVAEKALEGEFVQTERDTETEIEDERVISALEETVADFARSFSLLQRAVSTGDLPITEEMEREGGGVWLKGLSSYRPKENETETETVADKLPLSALLNPPEDLAERLDKMREVKEHLYVSVFLSVCCLHVYIYTVYILSSLN